MHGSTNWKSKAGFGVLSHIDYIDTCFSLISLNLGCGLPAIKRAYLLCLTFPSSRRIAKFAARAEPVLVLVA